MWPAPGSYLGGSAQAGLAGAFTWVALLDLRRLLMGESPGAVGGCRGAAVSDPNPMEQGDEPKQSVDLQGLAQSRPPLA